MKVYHLEYPISGVIFDIDGTLYRDTDYLRAQTDVLVRRLGKHLGLSEDEAGRVVEERRRRIAEEHEGRRPSLGNTFAALGVDIATSVLWREELLVPERYLREDRELQRTLDDLSTRLTLCALTNNPSSTGRRTLRALGVEARFTAVIGLDHTLRSKPDPAPFRAAMETLGMVPNRVAAVGDRYEIDLETPLTMGLGAVLVESMDDVYALPDLLTPPPSGRQGPRSPHGTTESC